MLLGIDLGTSSVKAVVVDADGAVLASGSASYQVASPTPGWAETPPSAWWDACVSAVRQAVGSRGGDVRAVGLSGQMHGVVLCDGAARPLRPAILWADGRSVAELSAYRSLPRDVRLRLANPPATGMAGPSLLWIRAHEPGVYRRARWALQPKDWLRLRLTGSGAAEPSDASGTLLFDLPGDRWSDEVVGALGLERALLASLVPSAAVAGELRADPASELGLRPGTPVAAGAADTAAAALGSGLLGPGAVQLTVGTGAQIVALSGEPRIDGTLRTHLFRAAAPQRWYAMAAIQNAGLALEWVRRVLDASWAEVYAALGAVPPGSDGLVFLPHLTGERTPHLDPGARGAWVGLRLGHGRDHLLRAALEGVAFAIREGLEALEAAGVAAPVLRLAGGGSLDRRWRQLLADVLGRPLHAVTGAAATASARGAALLGGIAVGLLSYDDLAGAAPPVEPAAAPRDHEAFGDAYLAFKRAYASLRALGPGPVEDPVL